VSGGKLLLALERVRRGARLTADEALELGREGGCSHVLVRGGRLSEHGAARLRARPLTEAELMLLRAVKRGEGRRVVKAHERPVLSALAAWGLVADGSGNRAAITTWGAEVLAHHEGDGE
jgi:hypothetical protein